MRASWGKARCLGDRTEWRSCGLDYVHSVLFGPAGMGSKQRHLLRAPMGADMPAESGDSV